MSHNKEKEHKIKVVITDLDGTLLNQHHTLSPISKAVIRALKEKKVHFLIATGRHHCDAQNIKKQLGVDAYIIAANGGTVLDLEGVVIHQAIVDHDTASQILDIKIPKGVYKNIYQGDHWMLEEADKVFEDYYDGNDFKYTLVNFKEQLDQPINKVFFTSRDHELLVPIAEQIRAQFSETVDVTFSLPECLEIMPKGTNKGQAVLKALALLNLTSEESIAFGDGMNDLEMLSVVGTGYVMGNANEQLKSSLPQNPQIGRNHDDAVAHHLIKLFGIDPLNTEEDKDENEKEKPLSAS